MSSESYKAWIDAMPIDDVRQKIERLERKLADLHVLERLYEGRSGGGESAPEPQADGGSESAPEGEGDDAGEAAHEPEGSEPVEGGGGWTQGEGSPEHG
jgi:hypothetical protein